MYRLANKEVKCNILLWCNARQSTVDPKESQRSQKNPERKHSGTDQSVSKCQQAEDDVDYDIVKDLKEKHGSNFTMPVIVVSLNNFL